MKIAFVICILTFHCALSSTLTPQLTSTYLTPEQMFKWNTSQVLMELDAVRQADITNVIFARAINANANHRQAYYPTKLQQFAGYPQQDLLSPLLDYIQSHGMTVIIGLTFDNNFWFNHSASNLTLQYQRDHEVLNELWSLYGHYDCIIGFYLVGEVCDSEWNGHELDDLINIYLQPMFRHIKELSPRLYASNAPYWANNSAPASVAKWWSTVIPRIPDCDLLIFQDGVGVAHTKDPATVVQYYKALQPVLQSHNVSFWSDLELFVKYPKYSSVPITRLIQQLRMEAPFVSGLTSFAFNDYMDPVFGNAQARLLYQKYLQYLE